ncbi:MAG TPA: phosphatidate cytidylyltransferase [Steroidobacter sp.]
MLRQRVITALVLVPLVLVVIFWVPHELTMGVLLVLVALAAWEWAAFAGFTRHSARLAYSGAVSACILAIWSYGVDRSELDVLMDVAILWWIVALFWVVGAPLRVNRAAAAIAGVLVLVPVWLALVRLHNFPGYGPQLMLFLLLLVAAADVGAYFAGSRYGRNKLAPKVSPGKTWEGVAGGVLAAAVLAALGVWYFAAAAAPFLMLCIVVVAASIVGDLTESLFKRHAGLKDSGSLLPGHGGLLDRVDSVTAAAPVFLVGLERLGLLR